jgi:broad specificity phosphatase PhoE
MAKKMLRIRLIHGTWGRAFFLKKPRWFEKRSLFRTRLELALSEAGIEADIQAFPWSGAQSVTARFSAAQALTAELHQEQADDPSVTQILIGHSHGGTIGMLAAHLMGARSRELLLATLATPFLQIHPGRLGSAFTRHLELWIANAFPSSCWSRASTRQIDRLKT